MAKLFGNAVVGQSGGPTCAINATLAGVVKGCLENECIQTVYGMKNGIEGFEREDIIEIGSRFENNHKAMNLLCATPAAALGSCRRKLTNDDEIERIFKILEKYNIRYFFYIGGNDSMDTIYKLSDYAKRKQNENIFEVKFIGVPKTIDNDLCVTDHTPGYGSAARFVATCIQEIVRDCAVYTKKAVTIVEIMGRDAGWLTAASTLANHICKAGPDLVYVPEVAFDEEEFVKSIKSLFDKSDKPYIVVAVSEGIKTADGQYAAKECNETAIDAFGHKFLSGAGKYLESVVKKRIGCKCRSIELNVLQRCSSHIASKCDIDEAFAVGCTAVECATDGNSGKVMYFKRKSGHKYEIEIDFDDVELFANKIKHIPEEFLSYDGKGVNDKCIEYMLPLIQDNLDNEYTDGLPVHFEF